MFKSRIIQNFVKNFSSLSGADHSFKTVKINPAFSTLSPRILKLRENWSKMAYDLDEIREKTRCRTFTFTQAFGK